MRRTGTEATERTPDEAAEEPAVLLVNWPNFVGPCRYCSGKHRVQTEIKNA